MYSTRQRPFTLLLTAAALAVVVSPVGCSDDKPPPAASPGGSSGSTGDASAEADSASGADSSNSDSAPDSPGLDGSYDSAAADSALADSATPDAGNQAETGQDAAANTTTVAYGPKSTWETDAAIALSSPQDDRLGSITPDELTIAWTVATSATTGTVWYADRTDPSSPFGPGRQLAASLGPFALDRAALSADGLRLAVLTQSRRAFVQVARASRSADFGSQDDGTFSMLNDSGSQMPEDQYFGDPVLSADGFTLYFSRYGSGSENTLLSISRVFPGDPWPVALMPAGGDEFKASGDKRKRPTGITPDNTGLFFYDEETQHQKVAWRTAQGYPFDQFDDLGAIDMAQSSANCRLYYSAPNNGSIDILSAPAKDSD